MFVSSDVEQEAYYETKKLLTKYHLLSDKLSLCWAVRLYYLILREEQRVFLQVKKLDFKEIKQLAHDHKANKMMS